jgi:hypothetical protein
MTNVIFGGPFEILYPAKAAAIDASFRHRVASTLIDAQARHPEPH